MKQLIVAASDASRIAPPGSDAQKVGDFYLAYMDTDRVESLGLTPLKDELGAHRRASPTPRDVARYIGHSQRIGLGAAVRVVLVARQQEFLGLPRRRSTRTGSRCPTATTTLARTRSTRNFRAKFAEYVEQMLARAGERNAKSAAARIAALETRIANYQWTKVQNRDPVKTYNPMTLPEYQKLAPGFDWMAFFEGMGAPVQKLDVSQPSFIKGIGQLVKTVPVADWRVYFKFQLLDDYAPALSAQFADLEFDFHQHTLNGVPEPRPRWRRAVDSMDDNMGELVGRMFVEAHFGAEAKATHARARRAICSRRSTPRSTGSSG